MEKQEAKSKWDELVRQLGAEISPEAEQLVETGPAPPVEPVSYLSGTASEEATQPLAPPKRPAAGWDNLANEFGLPVIEAPVAPPVEEAAVAKKERIASRVADTERPRRERPGQDRGGERHERQRESEKGREPSPRHREGSPRRRETPEKQRTSSEFRDRRESSEEVAEALPPQRSVPPVPRHEREERKAAPAEEPPKPGPAISLWHKIFGSPADQSAKLEEISTRTDEESVSSDPGAEQSMMRDAEIDRDPATADEFTPSEPDEFERGLDAEMEIDQPEQGERPSRRPRRRRRGRGGRGEAAPDARRGAGPSRHRSDEPPPDGDDYDGRAVDQDEDDLDLSQEADAEDAEDIDGAETGAPRSARGRASLARTIPTWDDAIGFIVDVNMQSRSQRRPSGHASPRGNSRGRPRGRRKN